MRIFIPGFTKKEDHLPQLGPLDAAPIEKEKQAKTSNWPFIAATALTVIGLAAAGLVAFMRNFASHTEPGTGSEIAKNGTSVEDWRDFSPSLLEKNDNNKVWKNLTRPLTDKNGTEEFLNITPPVFDNITQASTISLPISEASKSKMTTIMRTKSPQPLTFNRAHLFSCISPTKPSIEVPPLPQPKEMHPLNLLLDAPPIQIDKKTLLHMALDISSKGSGLEGNSAMHMLEYSLRLVRSKIAALKGHGICDDPTKELLCREFFALAEAPSREEALKLFARLEPKILEAIQITKIFDSSTDTAFFQLMQDKFKGLASDDSFFFSGGWKGHGLVYEIKKQPDQNLTLRIFNTGEGSEDYARTLVGTEVLALPFEEIVNIPPKNLLNPVILTALKQLQKDRSQTDPLGRWQLKNQIMPELKGQLSEAVHLPEEYKPRQQGGTCSLMPLLRVYSDHLGKQAHAQRFDFEGPLKALCDFDRLYQHTYEQDWQACNLLKKSIAAFNTLVTGKWSSLLTPEEKAIALQRTQAIKKRVLQAESSRDAKLSTTVTLDLEPNSESHYFPKQLTWASTPAGLNSGRSPPYYYKPVSVERITPSPFTILSEAKDLLETFHWYSRIKGLDREQALKIAVGNFLNVNEGIKQFAKNIPLHENDFWERLPPKEAEELVTVLAQFAEEFVFNLIDIGTQDFERKAQLKSSDYLALYKLTCAADRAARRSGILGKNFPSIYQKTWEMFFDNEAFYFTVIEPEWAMQMPALRKDWEQQKKSAENSPLIFDYSSSRANQMETWYGIPSSLKEYREKSDSVRSPELDWVTSWLQQPDNYAKIPSSPEFKKKELHIQAMLLLENSAIKQSVLPQPFARLGEMVFLLDYVLTGALSERTKAINILGQKEGWSLYSHHSWDDIYTFHRGFDTPVPEEERPSYNVRYLHLQKSSQEFLKDRTLSQLYLDEFGLKQRVSANQLSIQSPGDRQMAAGLNLQQFRKLLGLTSERALQVQETVGYFRAHPFLLSQQSYQDLFTLFLFDAGLLSEEFTHAGTFAEALAQFLQEGYEEAKANQNWLEAIFLLQTNRRCAAIYNSVQDQKSAHFMDSRAACRALVEETDLSEQERYVLYRELANSYTAEPISDAASLYEFLYSTIYVKRMELVDAEEMLPRNKFADIELRDAARQQREEIFQIIHKEGDALLNKLVQQLYPTEKGIERRWNLDRFPLCSSDDLAYSIDLLTGELFEYNAPLQLLPASISEKSSFRNVCGGKKMAILARQISSGVFEFVHKDITYRARTDGSWERLWEGNWQKLCTPEKPGEINFGYLGLVWQESQEQERKSYLIVDWKTHQPLYRAIENIKMDPKKNTLVIHQLDSNGKENGQVLVNLNKRAPLLSYLEQFEDFSQIIALQDEKTGCVKSD